MTDRPSRRRDRLAGNLMVVGPSALAASAVLDVAARPVGAGLLLAAGSFAQYAVEWAAAHGTRLALGYPVRAALRALVLLAVAAAWAVQPGGERLGLAALALGTLGIGAARYAVRAAVVARDRLRAARPSWRNLEVPGLARSAPVAPAVLARGRTVDIAAQAVVALGLVLVLFGLATWLLVALSALALAAAVTVAAVAALDLLRAGRESGPGPTLAALAVAVRDYQPDVVFYYSRPERSGYIANVWMPTLERLPGHRMLVVVRERHNLDRVATDRLPVVCVEPTNALEAVVPDTVAAALYPSNVAKNNHLVRLLGIQDVFVGHGDSDKGGSATTLSRVFDEVWVSGPAGRDRYRVAAVGVRDAQVREVGRPQLAEIARARPAEPPGGDEDRPGAPYTVLYAPTREGFFAEWEYSSVLTQGQGILAALLAAPGIRVLFKPHPGTGTDDPAYGREIRRLTALVRAAGDPHEVVAGTEGLYQAFNRADLLVSDVSSLITDFLASGKPYVVTSAGEDSAAFRRRYPSAGGAAILTGDGSAVLALVTEARTTDELRDRRQLTARYLLGEVGDDPCAAFDRAVDDAVAAGLALRQRHARVG